MPCARIHRAKANMLARAEPPDEVARRGWRRGGLATGGAAEPELPRAAASSGTRGGRRSAWRVVVSWRRPSSNRREPFVDGGRRFRRDFNKPALRRTAAKPYGAASRAPAGAG